MPKHEHRKGLERYLQSHKAQNPGAQDSSFLRKDMKHLIKQKNPLFPQVKKRILHAETRGEGDRFSISAVSLRTE